MTTALSNSSYNNNHSAGFTLIELMVTIAVLAIIVSIAAPNISTQLANQRVKATTATLENALKEAKAESVIRRQSITVAYNNNTTNAGTISLTDANSNQVVSYQYDAKSTIKVGNSSIAFSPNKTADATTYTICDSNTAVSGRQVAVTAVALISISAGGTC
ncbi:Tfp pilus assembly protein FimT/FimU [uncultured Psychrobacter sp.]|uniref:pilus assembly FimT family protein n=1 Tax=uncultured Psychrobacter sp. TaxID=259303 RepID=UPI00260C4804|nr:GspH/FimT family pseudopilin [uncultured Psychrobacter sp.]